MIIVPLGVASATPTATRHLSSVALWREGSTYLFDCGENTQMRMLQAGMKRSKIDCVFISHFDTDHYNGLIGLLSTLQLQRRERKITLVGPEGLQKFVEWNFDFADVDITFPIEYVEVEEGFDHEVVVDEEEFYVDARPLEHSKFCIGYRFQEKDKPGKVDAEKAKSLGISEDWQYKDLKAGKDVTLEDGTVIKSTDIVGYPRPGDSFAYVTDTEYCRNSVKLALNSNVLYHEATFGSSLKDKARETGHSTAEDAARVANEAKTKLLVITHFSARYTNQYVLLREARNNFHPTWVATELRPIMTDPSHEKGIIQPTVSIKELNYNNGKKKYNKGRNKKYSGKKRKPRKKFRKRRKHKSKSSGSSSNYRGKSSRSRSSSKSGSSKRYNKSDRYSKKRNNKDRNDDQRKPKPITPRTPFDDFDRF